ncbi:uncharacterized protein LOC126845174 isoform X2 [Adelges cooleyi]|nr:uncharacterized protein LOC126845174 isoform X2 [Adelges cooleyi]
MMKNFKGMGKVDLYCCISNFGLIKPVDAKLGFRSFSKSFRDRLINYIGDLNKKEKTPEELDNDIIVPICEKYGRWKDRCLETLQLCFTQFRKHLVRERKVTAPNTAYQHLVKFYNTVTKKNKKLKLKSDKSVVENVVVEPAAVVPKAEEPAVVVPKAEEPAAECSAGEIEED